MSTESSGLPDLLPSAFPSTSGSSLELRLRRAMSGAMVAAVLLLLVLLLWISRAPGSAGLMVVGAVATGLALLLLQRLLAARGLLGRFADLAREQQGLLEGALHEHDLIFRNSAAGIGFVKDRIVMRCNRGVERICGYSPEEMIGRSTRLLYPSDESFAEFGRQAYLDLDAGRSASLEWLLRRKDGSAVWVHMHGSLVDPNDASQGSIWVWQDIDARKHVEQRLKDALDEQSAVLMNISAGVLIVRDRRVARCNEAFASMIEYSVEELVGLPTRAYFESDEAHAAFAPAIYPTLLQGGIAKGDHRFQTRSGRIIWVNFHGKAIDPQDISRGVVFATHEITKHKQMEDDLSSSLAQSRIEADAERRLALSMAENSRTLETLSQIGKDITANLDVHAACVMLQSHVQGLLGASIFAVYQLDAGGRRLVRVHASTDTAGLPAGDVDMDASDFAGARALRQGCEIHYDWASDAAAPGMHERCAGISQPLLVNGQKLAVMVAQSSVKPVFSEHERYIFSTLCSYAQIALANADAVAALRTAQSQLVHSEKMASLGQLVANVAHEINTPIGAIKSSGSTIVDCLSEVLDKLPQVLLLLDDHERGLFLRLLAPSMRAQPYSRSSREERAQRRALAQHLEAEGLALPTQMADQLVQLDAEPAVQDLLPLLRHPQAGFVLGCAHQLGMMVRNAHNINSAVERVAKIVFALKTFSHRDASGKPVESALHEGLDTVLTIYQNQMRRGTELVRHFEDLPPLRCFPDELNQVWTNLIHNALQAMNYQGTLTVEIRREGGEAVVSVADTGCGIAPELRERIFEPFFTTKPTGEGSGLGLDIVKKIVEQHHGRIEVRSALGLGSTFLVYLPYAAGVR